MPRKSALNTLRNIPIPYVICWLLCVAIIGLSLWLRSRMDTGTDIAVYLYLSGRILDGARYYYDFFEFNLPLIFYIVAIPVCIARHLALSPIPLFTLFVTLVSIASIVLCARVLKGAVVHSDRPIYCALLVAVCFALFLPTPTLSNNVIGEKCLFMLAFTFPYFFSCFPRKQPMSPVLTAVTGILAGVGFCLKPHYFIIWAGIELYLAVIHRKFFYGWRAANFYIGGVTLAYLLCLLFAIPEYIEKILPIAPYLYFYKQDDTWLSNFLNTAYLLYMMWTWLFLVLIVLLTPRVLNTKIHETRQLLLCGFFIVFLEVAFEHLGFQRVQLYAFGVLLTFVLVVDFVRNIRRISPLRVAVAFPVLLTVLYVLPFSQIRSAYENETLRTQTFLDITLPYVEHYAKGKTLLVLSPNASVAFPLINYTGVRWNYKFLHVPAWSFFTYEKADKSGYSPRELANFNEARRYFYDALHYAMEHEPPAMIIAMEKISNSPEKWNFPEDLMRDKVFAGDWRRYRRMAGFSRTDKDHNYQYTIGIYTRI